MRRLDPRRRPALAAVLLYGIACAVTACVAPPPPDLSVHRWWEGLGPVIPHDSFPADCTLCHAGGEWNTMVAGFTFDHEAETGVPLEGAHSQAACLRCHNDRGPVEVFAAQGCAGCHEDVHAGDLGTRCEDCHQQETWQAVGMVDRHLRTRFPLVGVHAVTACWRCHDGGEVGNFLPVDTNCLTCHQADLAQTTNHLGLGWVDDCHRCHTPVSWNLAEIGG